MSFRFLPFTPIFGLFCKKIFFSNFTWQRLNLSSEELGHKMKVSSNIDEYLISETISVASNVNVYKGISSTTGRPVCIKKYSKPIDNLSYTFEKEVEYSNFLSTLCHPLIPQYLESFIYDSSYIIITDYFVGRHLSEVTGEGITEKRAKHIYTQLVKAVDYLHMMKVAHLNISTENVLISSTDAIRLIGLHKAVKFVKNLKMRYDIQPNIYCPPEALNYCHFLADMADSWALGIVLIIMVTGNSPYSFTNRFEIIGEISKGQINIPEIVSKSCQNLISHLLDLNVLQRYSTKQMLCHIWVANMRKYSLQGTKSQMIFIPNTVIIKPALSVDDGNFQLGTKLNFNEKMKITNRSVPLHYAKPF